MHILLSGGFMRFSDNFLKVEKKTNINKDTILSLANKLQDGNMKTKQL